jgi:hypothetical protein
MLKLLKKAGNFLHPPCGKALLASAAYPLFNTHLMGNVSCASQPDIHFQHPSYGKLEPIHRGLAGTRAPFNTLFMGNFLFCCIFVCSPFPLTPFSWETSLACPTLPLCTALSTPFHGELLVRFRQTIFLSFFFQHPFRGKRDRREAPPIGFLGLSTPFSWETVPNSLIFYYSSAYCQATFSRQKFFFVLFRCL